MRIRRPPLIVLSTIATAAVLMDVAGWFAWRSATQILSIDAERGAERLVQNPMLALPSAVQRSRRLPVRELGSATIDLAFSVLVRYGKLQQRWMTAHPAGPTNLARALLLAGDPSAAGPMIDQALVRDPTSAYLHRLRALTLMSRGDISAALESLAVAQALAPDQTEPDVELTPENQRAVRVRSLEHRLKLYPRRRLDTSLTLARELRRSGEIDEARAVLEGLGNHPEVSLELAWWAIEGGDSDAAVSVLEGIANRRSIPRSLRARAWSMMAVARDLDGDDDGALDAAFHALSLDRDSPHAFSSLADLAERRGDYDVALEHLRRAWGMAPSDVSLLVRIARVAEKAGKTPDAVLAMKRAVEIDPESAGLVFQLASLQMRLGDYTSAAMTLSQGLDRHPTDAALLDLADRLRRDVGTR